jgi:hypothetical protein
VEQQSDHLLIGTDELIIEFDQLGTGNDRQRGRHFGASYLTRKICTHRLELTKLDRHIGEDSPEILFVKVSVQVLEFGLGHGLFIAPRYR